MTKQRNILYVAPHGLGDLIMSLRAIEFLVAQNCRVFVMVKSKSERDYLLHATELELAEVIVLDEYRCKGKIIGAVALICKLRSTRFFAAVPQLNVNLTQLALLLACSGVKRYLVAVSVLREAMNEGIRVWPRHKVDINVSIAARVLGEPVLASSVPVWPSRLPRSTIAPRIAIAPGSGDVEAHKRWPASHYSALAREIRSMYPSAEIRIYGAPNEAELCKEIESTSKGAAIYSNVGSVTGLYDSMKYTDICVANCNGASHVAAHAGAIVVGIYGPTQAEHTGARCSYMLPISLSLDCSPCYRRGYISGCGNPVCMSELDVKIVMTAIRQILKEETE